jgi:hypothetical protein
MKIRSLLVTVALLIAIGIIVLQRSQISKLTAGPQPITAQNSEAASEPVAITNKTSTSPDDSAELLRLRAEVAALRKQTNELSKIRSENAQMREALIAATPKPATPGTTQEEPLSDYERAERALLVARLKDSRTYALALILHSEDNQQRFATNLDELAPYISKGGVTGTNDFDIMFQGSRNTATNASGTILIREHQPHQRADGRWTRAYGFLDGHSEIHTEPNSNFDDFERQHMSPPQ